MPLLPRARRRLRHPRTLLVVGVLALAVLGAGCIPDPPPPAPGDPPAVCDAPATSNPSAVSVMGPCSRLTVDQIVTWFQANTRSTYRASVPLNELVTIYLKEGQAEGVRGDIAFVQSIIETGWFSSTLTDTNNNFAGIGAVDTNPSGAAVFPDARTGVRAQIQHLRAYADATATKCTVPPLHNPCVDPRFDLVSPKGKAPTWNQFGHGIWATDPDYAYKVVGNYSKLLASAGLPLA